MSNAPIYVAGTIALHFGSLEIDGEDTPAVELIYPTETGAESVVVRELTAIRMARKILDRSYDPPKVKLDLSRLTNLGKTK
jgi:hypothetical protein